MKVRCARQSGGGFKAMGSPGKGWEVWRSQLGSTAGPRAFLLPGGLGLQRAISTGLQGPRNSLGGPRNRGGKLDLGVEGEAG